MLDKILQLLKPDVSTEAKLTGVSLYLSKLLEGLDKRLGAMETKVLIPLKDGVEGKKGDTGATGKAGRDGVGKDGVGKDGKDGVSVTDAEVAADGHFVFTLSNGEEIDAGAPLETSSKNNYVVSKQEAQQAIFIQDAQPASAESYLWIQTNYDSDGNFSLWFHE